MKEEEDEEWSFRRCSFKTRVKHRCDGKRVLRTPYGIIKSFPRHFKEHCKIPQLTVSVRFSVAHQSFVCYIVKVCKFNKRHRCAYFVNKCRDLLSHRHRCGIGLYQLYMLSRLVFYCFTMTTICTNRIRILLCHIRFIALLLLHVLVVCQPKSIIVSHGNFLRLNRLKMKS